MHTYIHTHTHTHMYRLENRILTLCTENPKGISDDVIVQDQPFIDTAKRVKALQRLLSQVLGTGGLIDLLPLAMM